MLYVCGLLTNEPQEIPSDGAYHVLRFGYQPDADEEQIDPWGMHQPDHHPDGHVVTDWMADPYAGLIYPAVAGYGELYAMVHWAQDGRARDQFCRDPLGFTDEHPVDTTCTEDRMHRFNAKSHRIHVEPGIPLSVRVRNLAGYTRAITHAQFKLYVVPDAEIARPAVTAGQEVAR